jgi:hypothetical protein
MEAEGLGDKGQLTGWLGRGQPKDGLKHQTNGSEWEVADMKRNKPRVLFTPPLATGFPATGFPASGFRASGFPATGVLATGLLVISFLAIGFLAGCPWSPKPDTKLIPVESNYLPQTSPENVIANLQTAYAERKIDEYKKLFSDDFTFVFNPADPIDPNHPSPPQWGLADELDVTENMFADELVTKIDFSSYVLGVPAQLDSNDYRPRAWKVRVDQANLQVYTRKPDGTLLTLLVDGATEVFFFVEEPTKPSPVDGRPTWYIFRWEDQPIGTKATPAVALRKPDA